MIKHCGNSGGNDKEGGDLGEALEGRGIPVSPSLPLSYLTGAARLLWVCQVPNPHGLLWAARPALGCPCLSVEVLEGCQMSSVEEGPGRSSPLTS